MKIGKRFVRFLDSPARARRLQRILRLRAIRRLDMIECEFERLRDEARGTSEWIYAHNDLYRLRRLRSERGL
jgi:hypothetical protein